MVNNLENVNHSVSDNWQSSNKEKNEVQVRSC